MKLDLHTDWLKHVTHKQLLDKLSVKRCVCLEIILILFTVYRAINQSEAVFYQTAARSFLHQTKFRSGIWRTRKQTEKHRHKTMQGGGDMQLHKLQYRRADPAGAETKDKLSIGFDTRSGSK